MTENAASVSCVTFLVSLVLRVDNTEEKGIIEW